MIRPELMVFWRRVEAADARIPVLRICAVKVVEAVFVSRLNFGNDDAVLAVTIQTLLFAQTCLCVCGRTDKFPLAPTVRHGFSLDVLIGTFAPAVIDVRLVIDASIVAIHMLRPKLYHLGLYPAVRIAHRTEELTVDSTVIRAVPVAGIGRNPGFQFCRLCAFKKFLLLSYRFIATPCLIIPLIAQILAAGSYLEGSKYIICVKVSVGACVRLARIVLWLDDDIGRAVAWYCHWGHRDGAHVVIASTHHAGLSLLARFRVGVNDGLCIILKVRLLVHSCTTIDAYLPVSRSIVLPLEVNIIVRAVIRFVVTQFETLVVDVAPMVVDELIAQDAKPVVAALDDGVGSAAVLAEFAGRTTVVAVVALTALRTGEVLVVVGRSILRTDAMLAMLPAALALVAVLAKFGLVEALATIHTKMLFPIVAIGTKAVLTVIILLTVFTQEAVLALLVIGALHAVGAEMVFIV